MRCKCVTWCGSSRLVLTSFSFNCIVSFLECTLPIKKREIVREWIWSRRNRSKALSPTHRNGCGMKPRRKRRKSWGKAPRAPDPAFSPLKPIAVYYWIDSGSIPRVSYLFSLISSLPFLSHEGKKIPSEEYKPAFWRNTGHHETAECRKVYLS